MHRCTELLWWEHRGTEPHSQNPKQDPHVPVCRHPSPPDRRFLFVLAQQVWSWICSGSCRYGPARISVGDVKGGPQRFPRQLLWAQHLRSWCFSSVACWKPPHHPEAACGQGSCDDSKMPSHGYLAFMWTNDVIYTQASWGSGWASRQNPYFPHSCHSLLQGLFLRVLAQ